MRFSWIHLLFSGIIPVGIWGTYVLRLIEPQVYCKQEKRLSFWTLWPQIFKILLCFSSKCVYTYGMNFGYYKAVGTSLCFKIRYQNFTFYPVSHRATCLYYLGVYTMKVYAYLTISYWGLLSQCEIKNKKLCWNLCFVFS